VSFYPRPYSPLRSPEITHLSRPYRSRLQFPDQWRVAARFVVCHADVSLLCCADGRKKARCEHRAIHHRSKVEEEIARQIQVRIRSDAASLATDRIYVISRLIRTKALLRARAQTTLTRVSALPAHRAIRTLAGLIWQQLRIRFRVEWIQLPALFRGDQLRLHLGARNGYILGCIRSAGGLCKDRCRRHCGCEQQATDKSTFHDQPLHSDRGDTRCIAYMKQSIHEPIDDQ